MVVSPLIALMHDQGWALEEAGVHAASSTPATATKPQVEREMMSGRLVLFRRAERITTPRFLAQLTRCTSANS